MRSALAILVLFLLIALWGIALKYTLVPLLVLMNGDVQASATLAVMVWILSSLLIFTYGQLVPGLDGAIREPGRERGEGKLATAPFRMAFVFGGLSSHCLTVGGIPDAWLWPLVIFLIAAGYGLGRDYRERVYELRKRYRSQINNDVDGRDHFDAFESTQPTHVFSPGRDDR